MLLVDAGLTDMSAVALIEAGRQRHPGLAVVLATGQVDPVSLPNVQLLPKPYDANSISALLSGLNAAA